MMGRLHGGYTVRAWKNDAERGPIAARYRYKMEERQEAEAHARTLVAEGWERVQLILCHESTIFSHPAMVFGEASGFSALRDPFDLP
jgi:hypothetical protein